MSPSSRGAPKRPPMASRAGRPGCVARRRAATTGSAGSTSAPQGWQLHASPLSVADVFRRQVDETGRAWIFTSATLAVGRDFSHYTAQLGLDRRRDRLLGQPVRLPDAGAAVRAARPARAEQREHTNAVVDAALPVLKASGGRAFLLFTTLRALNAARERLAAAFARERPRLSGARAGRRLEDRAAAALSRARQRGAARQRELLGRRRRSGRRAVGRRHRQAAVRAARRSAARRAARASSPPKAATRSWTGSCRRRRSA